MTDAGNSNDAGNSAENPRESSRENLVEVALQKRSSNREKVDFLLDAYTKAVNFRQKNWMQSVRFGVRENIKRNYIQIDCTIFYVSATKIGEIEKRVPCNFNGTATISGGFTT